MPRNHNRNVHTADCVPAGGGGRDDSATQALGQLITPQMFRKGYTPPPSIGGSHRIYVFWTHWSKRTILFRRRESGTCLVCARPCGVRASTPNTPGLRSCDLVTKQGRRSGGDGGGAVYAGLTSWRKRVRWSFALSPGFSSGATRTRAPAMALQ